MINYFNTEEIQQIKAQRRNILLGYFIALGIVICASIGFLVWYWLTPYKSPTITTIKIIHFTLIGIFVIFSFLYLGIPFKRVNRFYYFVKKLQTGIKERSVGVFSKNVSEFQTKDGVDCKSIMLVEWNKYKKDFFEREVLVFYEKPFPEIPQDATIEFVTQGNFLISYQILDEEQTESLSSISNEEEKNEQQLTTEENK